jgi:hypothetical protein
LHAPEETTEMEAQTEIPAAEGAVVQNEEVIPLETQEMETQTEIPVAEETTAQPEEVLPTNFPAPLETIDAETQTDAPATEETVVQTEEAFQSPEQSAIIDRLEAELVQTQQTLTQCRSEMVTMAEHQKVVKQLKAMSATENETFVELTRAQGKVNKVQGQLDKALEKIKEIFSVYTDAVDCRAPATNYTLFLLERYLLLRIKSIRAGKPIKFTTVSEFVSCFREQEEKVQYFLCELYLHNFILEENRKENPSPFIGDIQFQAFLSFTKNQTRWAKAHKTFMKRETGLDLWIRGEPPKSFTVIMQHRTFMKREGVVDSLAPIHRQVIRSGLPYFRELKEEALASSKLRWDASPNEVKSREPFGFKNFHATTFRVERYTRMILDEGPSWIGCRYSPPIIWYPPEGYQRDYQINRKREEASFEELRSKNGFRKPGEPTSPPYNIIALHVRSQLA